MILLDTHALLWLNQGHRRIKSLSQSSVPLYASPVSLMELQLLIEAGRLRLTRGTDVGKLLDDERWSIDDPPATKWFSQALEFGWTRDPFDRLLVAHARLRGWQLATADALLLEKLPAKSCIEL